VIKFRNSVKIPSIPMLFTATLYSRQKLQIHRRYCSLNGLPSHICMHPSPFCSYTQSIINSHISNSQHQFTLSVTNLPLNSTLRLLLMSYYLRRNIYEYLCSKCEIVLIMEHSLDYEDVGRSGINAPPIQLSAEALSIG
jgi:hypothetical protein